MHVRPNDNACPQCSELVDIGDGFDGEEVTCGCGALSVWTAFGDISDGVFFALVPVEPDEPEHRERFGDRVPEQWGSSRAERNRLALESFKRAHRHHHAVGGYSSALRGGLFVLVLGAVAWVITFGLSLWWLS